jgi:DNA-binding NarL/FixJ family response regulator
MDSTVGDIRLLFVDDERHVVEMAATALERMGDGFVVHTETNGEAALAHLDAERVDCVVSDYRMPEMDGLELLEAVREAHSNIPFILSTGKGSEDVASEAISAGVTDYLQKGGGLDQYTVLANRVANAVAQHRAERRLESQRDELATLDRINVVIQDIVRGLVAAATREEIATTVCERIAAAELYEFAWIAERDAGGEFAIQTGAGIDTGSVDIATADGGTAVTADELPEAGVVEVFESGAGPWQAAGETGPVAAVPLSYNDVVYGVLAVGATRPDAFSERERAGFAVLGEVAGFAINAAQNMKLLLSDTAVALELRVVDEDAFSTTLTERLGCRYVVDGVVPAADDTVLQYVTIEDADPERVCDLAAESSAVADCRLVSAHDDGGVFEVATRESPVNSIVGVGGTVTGCSVEAGVGTMTVEVAPETDVRAMVDAFERVHPGSELLSKHTVERPNGDANARRSVDERLTDKQRAALRAAYFAGYYEWPRRSTAEEIADSMGVSSPTLHNHLRKAQQKLLVGFLDEA